MAGTNGTAEKLPTVNGQPGAPRSGELTRAQQRYLPTFTLGTLAPLVAPSFGTYETYREMRQDPTIAIARAAATAPIKGADHSFEEDNDAPDGALELVQDALDAHWPQLIREGCRALDYGWQGLEIIWRLDGDGAIVPDRFKPLLPDLTNIVIGADHGEVLGLRQGDVTISSIKSLIYSYDSEAGNPYGRSRFENIRVNAWAPSVQAAKQLNQYFFKAAGIIPTLYYPVGSGEGKDGVVNDNQKDAQSFIQTLGRGAGAAFPQEFPKWAEDLIGRGVLNPKDVPSWKLDILETTSGHGAEIIGALQYFDALKMRGMLVPERAALEGTSGTKAEAGVHGQLGLMIAEETLVWMVGEINRQVVDTVLAVNYGPEARGKVRACAARLTSDERDFVKEILTGLFTNPANIDLVQTTLDLDAMIDQMGVPKLAEVVTPGALPPGIDPNAVAQQITQQPGPAQQAVADQSLNGAQIASMVQLVLTITARELPAETVRLMMKAAFPGVGDSVIDQIVTSAARQPAPPVQPNPPGSPLSRAMLAIYRRR